MNGSTTTSFALSFLLVAVAAVVFYQPDRPPPRVSAVGPNAKAVPKTPSPSERPENNASTPKSPPVAVTVPPAAPKSQAKRPRRPSSAFATVADGESLADVAARVYGLPEAAAVLFRANRDQIDRVDEKPPVGTVLRTPEADVRQAMID